MMRTIFFIFLVVILCGCLKGKVVNVEKNMNYSKPLLLDKKNKIDKYIIKWNKGYGYSFSFEQDYAKYLNKVDFHRQITINELDNFNKAKIDELIEEETPTGCRLAFDNDTNTHWDIGLDWSNTYILFEIPNFSHSDWTNYRLLREDGAPYQMAFFAGLSKDFNENNRPKRIILELYEVRKFLRNGWDTVPIEGHPQPMTYITNGSTLIYQREFELRDHPGYQYLDLELPNMFSNYATNYGKTPEGVYEYGGQIARLVIKDIYPGTKYSNTCITEIKFIYE